MSATQALDAREGRARRRPCTLRDYVDPDLLVLSSDGEDGGSGAEERDPSEHRMPGGGRRPGKRARRRVGTAVAPPAGLPFLPGIDVGPTRADAVVVAFQVTSAVPSAAAAATPLESISVTTITASGESLPSSGPPCSTSSSVEAVAALEDCELPDAPDGMRENDDRPPLRAASETATERRLARRPRRRSRRPVWAPSARDGAACFAVAVLSPFDGGVPSPITWSTAQSFVDLSVRCLRRALVAGGLAPVTVARHPTAADRFEVRFPSAGAARRAIEARLDPVVFVAQSRTVVLGLRLYRIGVGDPSPAYFVLPGRRRDRWVWTTDGDLPPWKPSRRDLQWGRHRAAPLSS